MNCCGLLSLTQIVLLVFGEYRDQENRYARAAINVDCALSTTLAATFTRSPHFSQATALGYPRFRVGCDIVHEAKPFSVSHDVLCPPEELRQFHDGLQGGHNQQLIRQQPIRQ